MELAKVKAWFLFNADIFPKPCGFIRGRNFISQPFFSKMLGRVAIALVSKNLLLGDDEVIFLRSTLEDSSLPEAVDHYDLFMSRLGGASDSFERLTAQISQAAIKGEEEVDLVSLYKPLRVYFDALNDLTGA